MESLPEFELEPVEPQLERPPARADHLLLLLQLLASCRELCSSRPD